MKSYHVRLMAQSILLPNFLQENAREVIPMRKNNELLKRSKFKLESLISRVGV